MPKTLHGGTFNLEYGRDPERVAAEVAKLFVKHRLDFLAVQEFSDYVRAFRAKRGFQVFPTDSGAESGVLVRAGLLTDKPSTHTYGDGWTTIRGGHFPKAVHHQIRIDGWLYVRSVHWPTPSSWPGGHPDAPPERLDDLIATAKGVRRYLAWPCVSNARLAAGDWNEPPSTAGTYSPRWVAEMAGAQIAVPESLAGHGRIDYAIAKGCRVEGIFKDTTITEFSDHEPVIFKVVKG